MADLLKDKVGRVWSLHLKVSGWEKVCALCSRGVDRLPRQITVISEGRSE